MNPQHRRRNKSYNEPGHAHELTFSCFKRLPLLSRDRTRRWFLEALDTARLRLQLALWAYVIMPEHVHVIVWRERDYQNSSYPHGSESARATESLGFSSSKSTCFSAAIA
jgi:putative transposase